MALENDSLETAAPAGCDHCGGSPAKPDGGVLRCECGSLLARYVDGRIELKCRRCKRTLIVPASSAWEEDTSR